MMEEPFRRRTISFYRYFRIENPREYRNDLYLRWKEFSCLGRIYVAKEGINAQMSIPEFHLEAFSGDLNGIYGLSNIPIKYAVEDDGKSFFKLTIKVREKIVADGLEDLAYDVANVGTHLSARDFHDLSMDPGSLVLDMRNHYEFEVGHFRNALHTDSDTFSEAMQKAVQMASGHKDRPVLLYCTGGIRCEKASAWFRHHGFKNVYQLHGGIIEYAQEIRRSGLNSEFTGKNFVFDARLGESIDGKVISKCHQCGNPCDTHTNCANNDCHLLFIQCEDCREKNKGCCSEECMEILSMSKEVRKKFRKEKTSHYSRSKIFYRNFRSFNESHIHETPVASKG